MKADMKYGFVFFLILMLVSQIALGKRTCGNFEFGTLETSKIYNEPSQGKIKGKIIGLEVGDSAIVRVQKNSMEFFFRKLHGTGQDVSFSFEGLSNGKWALSMDAKGYAFPSSKTLEINNNVLDNTITIVKSDDLDYFSYSWQDDESYVGHAQQAYINDVVEIEFLGQKERVPDDFSAIYLYNQYGFLLSNEEGLWTTEEAYRLFLTVQKLPFQKFGEGVTIFPKAKWIITDDFIDKDISYTQLGDGEIIRISRSAFTYATPQIVTVDGAKGKFFSKRLFNALIYYHTDGGSDVNAINRLAKNNYGIDFIEPSEFVRNLMGETESNFQIFTPEEKIIIVSMLEEFPDAMQRQEGLKYMVRRINGQQHPIYSNAPAIAWTGLNTIEWMESGFKDVPIESMQRLVLHEKAHFLWEYSFDQNTKNDWADLGGWFLDPTSDSGWSTTNTTEFVSAYGHLKDPNEDMAESIAFYITNPEALRSRSLRKFEFIRDRIMNGSRYISIIRPDLTFEVFNLFPDFNYPGKIIRTKLDVFGGPEDDKKIVFEIELKVLDSAFDGAIAAQCRFVSPVGTFIDMWLNPINDQGSVLRGEIDLSKFSKSGYWNIPQVMIWDAVGNTRLENNTTFGVKVFVNNPLEDVTAPYYVQNSLKLEKVDGEFSDFSGDQNKENGTEMQAVRLSFDIEEKNTIQPKGRVLGRLFFPQLDLESANQSPPYSRDVQISKIINDYTDSLKSVDFYFPVPDYYPSGYYSMSFLLMTDIALNTRNVFFDTDTSNNSYVLENDHQRALRDSIYIETPYPDYKPPLLDLNDIKISAVPTNPISPNGETQFEMWIWIKDESDFEGMASGFSHGSYTLRDPQGQEYTFQIFDVNHYYSIIPDESIHGYKRYYVKNLLPQGSPPGIWGVSSIHLYDKAGNRKFYNFVEYVRFDVETSDILQVEPTVEFLDKAVNVGNLTNGSLVINCENCKDQFYRLRIYSSMGGNSVVVEGQMTADSIILENINLQGVNDGVLFATVFMLDAEKALIGVGKTEFNKDTVIPKAKLSQSNLGDMGISNLDQLKISIVTEEEEIDATYRIVISQYSSSESNARVAVNEVILDGPYNGNSIDFDQLPLSQFEDGVILIEITIIDNAGNESETVQHRVYKDTKRPVIDVRLIGGEGLISEVELIADEYISNSLDAKDIVINNGVVNNILKISNGKYKLSIIHDCFQNIELNLKEGAFLDTVKNENLELTRLIEKDWSPNIRVKNLEAYLDEMGKLQINAKDFDNQSETPCGDLEYFISKESFTCEDLGEHDLTFSVKDSGGFTNEIVVKLFIRDTSNPIIKLKSSLTLNLDAEGKVILKLEDIDEGSTDNCGITERILSKSELNCSDLGENTITFTAKDASGNESTAEVTVTVLDDLKPNIVSKSEITVQLDSEGKAILKWEDIDEGSTDNCGITERILSKSEFTRDDSGENIITYTLKDASGNISTSEIKVKVDMILSTSPLRNEIQPIIRLYPNPAKNSMVLEFERIVIPGLASVEIMDAQGRSMGKTNIFESSGNSLRIDTSSLSNGIYFLKITYGRPIKVLKFVIEK